MQAGWMDAKNKTFTTFDKYPPEVPEIVYKKFSSLGDSTSHVPHSLRGWLDELIRQQIRRVNTG
jgi:hypothetical protein